MVGMIRYCSDDPKKCGLGSCLQRGCILNDPPVKGQTTLDEDYQDMCARLQVGEFKVAVLTLSKKVKKKRSWSKPKRISSTGHFKCFEHLIVNGYVHCHYCHTHLMPGKVSRDHVLAKSKGGKLSKDNVVPACRKCNEAKADMDYYEFLQSAISLGIFISNDRRKELTVYLNIKEV